jgi:hypothetical protein
MSATATIRDEASAAGRPTPPRSITVDRADAKTLRRMFKRMAAQLREGARRSTDTSERYGLELEAAACLACLPIPSKADVAAGAGPLRLRVESRSKAFMWLGEALDEERRSPTRKSLDRAAVFIDTMRALCDVPSYAEVRRYHAVSTV